jgi:ribosome-binding protein aMBF1 (putative translation factor)
VVWLGGEAKTLAFLKAVRVEADDRALSQTATEIRRARQGVNGMKKSKRERLEAAGWRVGNAGDLLGLTTEETVFVEMKLALADSVRRRRQARGLSQAQLARRLGTSQSRVAKMEAADSSVSIDLLMKALLEMGASRAEVARAISKRVRRAA